MAKFRERRNSLEAEMLTLREFSGRPGLLGVVREILDPWGVPVTDESMSVVEYWPNDRLGWNSHIVHIKGYGVLGYTDGPVEVEG